jgi:hypothetical protein
MSQRKQQRLLLKRIRQTPYLLTVETDRTSTAVLAVALGRTPDAYTTNQGHLVAMHHYTTCHDTIGALRKVPAHTWATVSDVRIQLSLPPISSKNQLEQNSERDLTMANRALFTAPFVVSAGSNEGYDPVVIVGRAPFLVVGEVDIFTFDDFDEAVAACTRLVIANGTSDDELPMNSEIS